MTSGAFCQQVWAFNLTKRWGLGLSETQKWIKSFKSRGPQSCKMPKALKVAQTDVQIAGISISTKSPVLCYFLHLLFQTMRSHRLVLDEIVRSSLFVAVVFSYIPHTCGSPTCTFEAAGSPIDQWNLRQPQSPQALSMSWSNHFKLKNPCLE